MTTSITIYTDGACSGNPGPGGWGAILIAGEFRKEMHGFQVEATSNQMELMAAIEALKALTKPSQVTLFTDSQYLQKAMIDWLPKWKTNGWKTSAGEAVKNIDLWKMLDPLSQKHKITWRWVKGHNGHDENERADTLARMGVDEAKRAAAEATNTNPSVSIATPPPASEEAKAPPSTPSPYPVSPEVGLIDPTDLIRSLAGLHDQITALRVSQDRYEALRLCTPVEFSALYNRNLNGENFDKMIDELIVTAKAGRIQTRVISPPRAGVD